MSNRLASGARVLILTVGTGYARNAETSLYSPMMKSVSHGSWDHVVLLPSEKTQEQARILRERIAASCTVEIRPIPDTGNENDADACFTHFDGVIRELIKRVGSAECLTLDFTRGTKAMSAGLLLAGAAAGIPVVRYVHGRRGERGLVLAGAEEVSEFRTDVVGARQRLDLANHLLLKGDFEAVPSVLENVRAADRLPESIRGQARAIAEVAKAYAAWDRFDYRGAMELLKSCRQNAARAGNFAPTPVMDGWVGVLAQPFDRTQPQCAAQYLRHLVCDMLANAERRLRDGHYEDAAVRCYRVLELVGQIRLFDRGLDTGNLPECDERVDRFQRKLKKKKSDPLSRNSNKAQAGTLSAGRYQVARFLQFLKDPLGSDLLRFDNSAGPHIKSRNHGILIHGFEAKASELRQDEWNNHMNELEALLLSDDPEASIRLASARLLDFSGDD